MHERSEYNKEKNAENGADDMPVIAGGKGKDHEQKGNGAQGGQTAALLLQHS